MRRKIIGRSAGNIAAINLSDETIALRTSPAPRPASRRFMALLAVFCFTACSVALADDDTEKLRSIAGTFGDLRIAVYVITVAGTLAGLAVYTWYRRHLLSFPFRYGLAATVFVGLLALWITSVAAATTQSHTCAIEHLAHGAGASPYDLACREYRELPGNAFGFVDGWRYFGGLDRHVDVEPISSFAARTTPYLSVAVVSLFLFVLTFGWLPKFARLVK